MGRDREPPIIEGDFYVVGEEPPAPPVLNWRNFLIGVFLLSTVMALARYIAAHLQWV